MKYNTSLIEAVKIVYDEDEEASKTEQKIKTAFRFVNEEWIIKQIKHGMIHSDGSGLDSNGFVNLDWLLYLGKISIDEDAEYDGSYDELLYIKRIFNDVIETLENKGIVEFKSDPIFDGSVRLTDDYLNSEVSDFSLDEAYDTSLHHSYHDWRREIVNPIVDEIISRLDRSWVLSMLAREQMERTLTNLVPRIDIDFAIDTKSWIELNTFGDAKEDPNLSDIYQFVKNAAQLHVYNLLDELEREGIVETVKKFGGGKSELFKLTDKFVEKETSDFNLDEGKSFSEFTPDDKRLISIIKKEYPLPSVKRLIVKEIISNQSTSTRSDTCFRLLVRRNVASVMFSNRKREDVWNAINEYTEFVINTMCLDGELTTYEDEQTGHDMIKLSDEFISKDVKGFTLDESFDIDCGEQTLIDKILSKYDDEWMLNLVKDRYFEELEPVSIIGLRGSVIRSSCDDYIKYSRQDEKLSFGGRFNRILAQEANKLGKDLVISLISKGILTISRWDFAGNPAEVAPSESYLEKETSEFNLDESLRKLIRGML